MKIVILTIFLEKLLKLLEVLFLVCARATHRKSFDYLHLLDTVFCTRVIPAHEVLLIAFRTSASLLTSRTTLFSTDISLVSFESLPLEPMDFSRQPDVYDVEHNSAIMHNCPLCWCYTVASLRFGHPFWDYRDSNIAFGCFRRLGAAGEKLV